ncbi:carbonic anhydrase [Fluviispira sanaruensis]|uniref:carbonic anhydrase n=1 Tax=Fluviispira sanaruensis TaxID=2493639 RepID=A0A4P2VVZ5_FLUSA|nr:carbonic anhydrase [Fluviispira sanaruensis]BBH53112.1 carbonic anhydrase [Fluviispira sanaruensis]
MKKLINGITEFRKKVLPGYRDTFARLALGQSPDALFIACSDSRVVPNLFASTDPGDLFVVRNVGNLIPPCSRNGFSVGDESEAAAIEFSITQLRVSSIIICGHSECGAMQSLVKNRNAISSPNLRSWLQYGEPALQKMLDGFEINPGLQPHNQLSQINVLEQKIHLESYPIVQDLIKSGNLRICSWWFDIATADVYSYNDEKRRFVLLDDEEAARILAESSN